MRKHKLSPGIDRRIPSPRLTIHGALMIVLYAGTPLLAIGVLLDMVVAWLR
ncbi:hypothetical protein [Geminicoccus roseus]|uniref:hypothetical protein n=1 Tax=Geminicoccus roseus TaxID=404900 RepID=UPI0003F98219|nr:hypothetical protein [Geminicoccus roseus]